MSFVMTLVDDRLGLSDGHCGDGCQASWSGGGSITSTWWRSSKSGLT